MQGFNRTETPLADSLKLRARFPLLERAAYLNTAAEGLLPADSLLALEEYVRHKSEGSRGRRLFYEAEHRARQTGACLLGVQPADIAFLPSASDAMNLLANSIDWRPDDQVLLNDLEFPSNVLPWLRLRERGVRIRVIPSQDGVLGLEQFLTGITPKTRLVSISYVSYLNGAKVPFLEEICRSASQVGAIVCVDATQALGRVPVSAASVDYLVASGYKWLLGAHGAALVYLAPALAERLCPASVGWHSVQEIFTPDRFERFTFKQGAQCLAPGMPDFPAIYTVRKGMELLMSVGVDRIDCELRPLVNQLRDGLVSLGLRVLTPASRSRASGIVSFAHPRCAEIGQELERRDVVVWSGDGRVRASVHLYNEETDVRSLLTGLREILQGYPRGQDEAEAEGSGAEVEIS